MERSKRKRKIINKLYKKYKTNMSLYDKDDYDKDDYDKCKK